MTRHSLSKDMPAMRAAARDKLELDFAVRLAVILGPAAPVHLRKAMEAERVLQGASSILLATEARARGLDESALARLVIERAERQAKQIASLEVERQEAQVGIEAATNPAEIEAVLFEHGA